MDNQYDYSKVNEIKLLIVNLILKMKGKIKYLILLVTAFFVVACSNYNTETYRPTPDNEELRAMGRHCWLLNHKVITYAVGDST